MRSTRLMCQSSSCVVRPARYRLTGDNPVSPTFCTAEFCFMGSRRRRRRRALGQSPTSVVRIHPGTPGSRFAPPVGTGGAAPEVARPRGGAAARRRQRNCSHWLIRCLRGTVHERAAQKVPGPAEALGSFNTEPPISRAPTASLRDGPRPTLDITVSLLTAARAEGAGATSHRGSPD